MIIPTTPGGVVYSLLNGRAKYVVRSISDPFTGCFIHRLRDESTGKIVGSVVSEPISSDDQIMFARYTINEWSDNGFGRRVAYVDRSGNLFDYNTFVIFGCISSNGVLFDATGIPKGRGSLKVKSISDSLKNEIKFEEDLISFLTPDDKGRKLRLIT